MTLRSTAKTAVHEIAPGVYRVVEVGGSASVTRRYVLAVNEARAARKTVTPDTKLDASKEQP